VKNKFGALFKKRVTPLFLKRRYKEIKNIFKPWTKPLTREDDKKLVEVI